MKYQCTAKKFESNYSDCSQCCNQSIYCSQSNQIQITLLWIDDRIWFVERNLAWSILLVVCMLIRSKLGHNYYTHLKGGSIKSKVSRCLFSRLNRTFRYSCNN